MTLNFVDLPKQIVEEIERVRGEEQQEAIRDDG